MHDSRYRVTCVETNEPERTSREWKEGMEGRERESELLIVNRTKESSVSSGRHTDDGSEEMDEGGRIPRRAMC